MDADDAPDAVLRNETFPIAAAMEDGNLCRRCALAAGLV
jgi:hypothetical protein